MADNVIVRVPEQQFIKGEDGYSPEVTIEDIAHGHRVTITDKEHPEGQTADVMDGDSAYEQAVAGGYTKSEAQFNAELASFKELSDETKEAAPFYAEYGVTTKAEIEAAINGKRQIYAYQSLSPYSPILPYVGKIHYDDEQGSGTGYRFSIIEGTTQIVYELMSTWVYYTNDLSEPAQRAEAAAAQALIRMNSADASAQAAEDASSFFTSTILPNAVTTVNNTKDQAVANVNVAKSTAVQNVQAEGATQISALQTESATQQAAIEQKGEDVLDSIPSDYTELSEDVDDLKSAFNADLVATTWTPIITKGSYFKVADGSIGNSGKYARTSTLWDGYGTLKAIVVDDPTYEFCLALYDETGDTSGTGYLGYIAYTTGTVYIPQNAIRFGVSFRRVDQAALTDEDKTAISAALSALAATDTTLSVAGAPADAKATGDMLSTTILEKDILPANTDLNTFTDIGLYRIPSGSSVLPTLVNYPSDNPGRLLVLSDENGYYCTQVVITSGNVIYTRVQTSASGHTWTEWASYDGTTVRQRSGVKDENNRVDVNLTLTNGVYSFNRDEYASSAVNLPSPYAGILLVFAGTQNKLQIYVNRFGTVYYRTKHQNYDFSEWIRPLKADTTLSIRGAAADAKVVGDAVSSGYVHDGDILRMSTTPEAIPVNENHMGYNEFISSTWNTLLPTGYQEGDAYNASTTKIHGVKVERASSWTSTPYGANTDTYTIYRYIFTPQNGYDKTLFLTSGCHGNEAEAYWSLYRLVRMIYFEGHKYPTLRNLRDCRLIIIPSWNPWGFQHYRRYNAFESKNYQAWAWLMATNHEVTVNGTVYDISQVGEANVIWQTLQDYGDSINLWLDFHTDPYAGRDTTNVDIDDPRGVTPPYGCYGFSAKNSRGYRQLFSVMYDFYNILEDEYQFTETWHPQATNPGGSSFTGWMAQFGFPGGIVEVSTFMDNFPYPSGSAGMMKLAQEYYGNCITEMLR